MGYLAASTRFLKVMAMVSAGSQVTKLIRAAGLIAKYRPTVPVFAIVTSRLRTNWIKWMSRQLLAVRGVFPVLTSPDAVYNIYGFMLLVVLIVVIATVCVTIVGAYCLLNAENYH